MPDNVPPPTRTPPPYTNGKHDEVTGVWERPRTGQTRRMVWLSVVVAGVVTLLQPVCNAIAARIAQGPMAFAQADATKDGGQ